MTWEMPTPRTVSSPAFFSSSLKFTTEMLNRRARLPFSRIFLMNAAEARLTDTMMMASGVAGAMAFTAASTSSGFVRS